MRDEATQRQVDAADPGNSTWLSANAGSGKTRVLTDRVARLLLDGVDPQNILCLTYTKAAAAEMQNRLFKRLGAWAMMADNALHDDLRRLGVDRVIDAEQLRAARTLFARAIETPGGLKIQTIHSFCAGILRRFPLEAGVSPQFREMEDRDAQLLREEVMDTLVTGVDSQAVHDLLALFTGADLARLTAEVAAKRDSFACETSRDVICEFLGVDPTLTPQSLIAQVFDADSIPAIADLRTACATGSTNDQKAATALAGFCPGDHPTLRDLQTLETVFLFGEGTKNPFGAKVGSFPTKATRTAHSDLMETIEPLMIRVESARKDRLALQALERTLVIYRFGQAFVPAYEARKLAMGALDFDDLIRKARALLTDPGVAQWVLFRLDGGIDHLLVDEAQDTSPTQWAVIERLTQEFAAGIGARSDRERTVFVVGDKKQSIYSFQGADPAAFNQMKNLFHASHRAVQKPFVVTSLDHSFRSSQAILSVVDATFTGDRAAGMDDELNHIAFKDAMPGRVDLWPPIEKAGNDDSGNWWDPVDQPGTQDHNVLMAARIAGQIKRMIAQETIPVEIGETGVFQRRPISEGDFLILVQRRSDLFAEIIRACKAAGLKIAGADRLRVGAELAVKDLAALLSFLALPEDDLSLAATLRSPLFGWSEQDLFTLAHHRPEKGHLWPALRSGDYPETLEILHDLRREADFLRPYDLIERILTRHDGRRNLLGRLGPEAEDGIDALLSQALAYENTGVPSLTGFLIWMETDDLQVKRQMDSQSDQIRVMTVHGAKGLESPIVILPDTVQPKTDIKAELLPAGEHGEHVVWKTPKAESAPAVTNLRDLVVAKQARERLRLLYVAMTRAEKWLIVGAAGNIKEDDDSWHNIVASGMDGCGVYDAKAGDLPVRRVSHLDWDVGTLVTTQSTAIPDITLPVFGTLPVPDRVATRAPSELPGEKTLPSDVTGNDADAMARGTLIHRLLEHLPVIAPAKRMEFGLRLIEQDDPALVAQVISLLDNPALAHLWADNALTEVDITADIPGIGRIHGAIDRLLIATDCILAVDYKSNAVIPDDPAQTPAGLLRQMAVYHHALGQIYPDMPVQVAILWTASGRLTLLPDDLLSGALANLPIP
ncbi:double-strand break repair helicase AddA [Yoonia sp.]|uniref:double-strand break repair helicase AddA n=1 Tax=Yoonia sp. TaxID=2212373 RepID=UPI0025E20D25|nr:double-strand break repair helicase AddA [Yoonia sp.]